MSFYGGITTQGSEYGQHRNILSERNDGSLSLISTNQKGQVILSPESDIQGSLSFPEPGQKTMDGSIPVMFQSETTIYGQEKPKEAKIYTLFDQINAGINVLSDPLDVSQYRSASLHLNIGRNKPVIGTMFLQGCNDIYLGSWKTIDTTSSSISTTYDNLSYILQPIPLNYKWIRAVCNYGSRVQQAITPNADSNGSLRSKYLILNSAQSPQFPFAGTVIGGNSGNTYYPFYKVAGTGTAPSNVSTPIPVELGLNDSLANVCSKTATVVNGLAIGGYVSNDGGKTVTEFALSPAGDTTQTQWHIAATGNTCVLKPYDKTKSYVSQDNGTTWTYYASSGIPQRAKFIKGCNGSFVAVGIDMLGNYGVIYTSSDAITWTKRVCTITTPIVSVDCDPVHNLWVAVTTNKIITSSDLINWTPLNLKVSLQQDWAHVAYNGNTWVAITKDTTSAMYCSNGNPTLIDSWQPSVQISDGSTIWHTISANPNGGSFIAISTGGKIEISLDGTSWKAFNLPVSELSGPYSLTWDQGSSRFVHSLPTSNLISADGLTWEIYPHRDISENRTLLASASTGTKLISCFAVGLPSDFCNVYSYGTFIVFQGSKSSGMLSVDPGNTGFTFKRIFPDEDATLTLKICCK